MNFFITGITGFLGSFLAFELMRQGHHIIALIRPKQSKTAEERFQSLTDFFEVENNQKISCQVVEGYLNQPGFGLKKELYQQIGQDTAHVIHCAGSTAFSNRKKDEVENSNIHALQNILEFTAFSSAVCFHHISTSYSIGSFQGLVKEEFHHTKDFTNVYENSKNQGEFKAAEFCLEHGLDYNIYRPSIVYGDSRTGKSLRFNALYFPVKTLAYLRKLFYKDIIENGGEKAREMGIYLNENNDLYLPIRILSKEKGRINIIPIEYFVSAVTSIIFSGIKNKIFHIVNQQGKDLAVLADFVENFFHLTGLEILLDKDINKLQRNPLESLFDNYISVYGDYMNDERVFDDTNTRSVLEPLNISCPDFTYRVFTQIMKYAVKMDWGKKIHI